MTLNFDLLGFGGAVQLAAALAALVLLVAAAIDDARRYRISNRVVIAIVVCFAVFVAAKASWPFLAWSLAAGASMLALAAVLFALGVFGGGDAKLIAAMALWTQFAALPRFLVVMSAFGGALGLVWIIRRRMAKPSTVPVDPGAGVDNPAVEPSGPQFSRLPYGIAIALAGMDFFIFGATSPLIALLSS